MFRRRRQRPFADDRMATSLFDRKIAWEFQLCNYLEEKILKGQKTGLQLAPETTEWNEFSKYIHLVVKVEVYKYAPPECGLSR